MCSNIIIDANVASKFIKLGNFADEQLNTFIKGYHLRVVYSNSKEWKKEMGSKWRRRLDTLREGGQAQLNKESLSDQITILKEAGDMESEDYHIIALARLTGTNLLYSDDVDLKKDFKNKHIITSGKGKLYPSNSNRKEIKSFLERHKCRKKK